MLSKILLKYRAQGRIVGATRSKPRSEIGANKSLHFALGLNRVGPTIRRLGLRGCFFPGFPSSSKLSPQKHEAELLKRGGGGEGGMSCNFVMK